jgi:hypothetical protein
VVLSALRNLPAGFTLKNSFFLEWAYLPTSLAAIPGAFLHRCARLLTLNVADCEDLERIEYGAFRGCRMLGQLPIPPRCSSIDSRDSGIVHLDLGWNSVTSLDLARCMRLIRLILPPRFRGSVSALCLASLSSLTLCVTYPAAVGL